MRFRTQEKQKKEGLDSGTSSRAEPDSSPSPKEKSNAEDDERSSKGALEPS
jgi:hypothetical protein